MNEQILDILMSIKNELELIRKAEMETLFTTTKILEILTEKDDNEQLTEKERKEMMKQLSLLKDDKTSKEDLIKIMNSNSLKYLNR